MKQTSIFDNLMDGESFIIMHDDPFYKENGTYYVFEKTVPYTVYSGRKTSVLNARRMPDECYCEIPGHLPVMKVGVLKWQLAADWDFEGAIKEEPQIEIDYGDSLDDE